MKRSAINHASVLDSGTVIYPGSVATATATTTVDREVWA